MTDEQRFLFDLQGYLVLSDVLDAERIGRMRSVMDAHGVDPPVENTDSYRFGDFLHWGADFRDLIDHPRILPILAEILGPRFRLDHAYGMATHPSPTGTASEAATNAGMHHTAAMFHHACYYVTHGARMHNGLVVASYALTDIEPGAGGFCCIPGSHKAIYPMPREYFRIEGNPLVRQIPQKAGDVLIFTEGLTHGTWPWRDVAGQRRSLLLKYAPLYLQWARRPLANDIEGLTERQKLLLEGPYVAQRAEVTL